MTRPDVKQPAAPGLFAASAPDSAERQQRLDRLIAAAHDTLTQAIRDQITDHRDGHGRNRTHAATAILFSGGNDSTVLAHLFRGRATHAIHANTGIGVEATRQFVRDACTAWGIPLIEKHPPAGSTYREMVLTDGFPGPAKHWKMYQRLKERGLDAARKDIIGDPRRERVVFLAGRRRSESARRANIPKVERRKSTVWVSPLRDWTALDLNAYRARNPDCPRNEVADALHMSGECLCGAFAAAGELDQLSEWPHAADVVTEIRALEREARVAGIPEPRCRWGWGADTDRSRVKSGVMCSSCETRGQMALFDPADTGATRAG
jgi:3'-phosphoadenosine 5'-phosphosulfate sulfotransferase (PAPS reductase)/FAD synthetase